jgi:hypothetical protein
MKTSTCTALAGLVLAAQAQAAGEHYGQALGAYKSDLNKEPPSLFNAGFIGDHAVSAAHRNITRADARRSAIDNEGGDINIASPQINGNVHGDVNVIVQRGALRGNVTSVRR